MGKRHAFDSISEFLKEEARERRTSAECFFRLLPDAGATSHELSYIFMEPTAGTGSHQHEINTAPEGCTECKSVHPAEPTVCLVLRDFVFNRAKQSRQKPRCISNPFNFLHACSITPRRRH